jgi:hypothetical protein
VELAIEPSDPADAHPAHIHGGSCDSGGGIVHPLDDVVDGSSVTTLMAVSLSDVTDGAHYINVHESAANLGTTIACGDIPEADAVAPTEEPTPEPTVIARVPRFVPLWRAR